MNTDLRKIFRDALRYEFEKRFGYWIKVSSDFLANACSDRLKNSLELRLFLTDCEEFEIEEGQNYIAFKIKEDIKSSYMKLEDYNGRTPIIEGNDGVLPTYEICLRSPIREKANADSIVIVLGKFIDEYKFQAICDSNYWGNAKCKSIKSREYVSGKEISKEKAIDLGFKYIKVGD